MADSQRKTANLFDKDNTTIYNAYFDASGSWILSADSKSVKMPCQPNTQYTLSVPNSLTVFRVYESNNASVEPSSTSPPRATEITRGTNISQYTFTTSSTAQIILFQGSNGAVTEWFNGLMLNTGSTALPYEPYGWQHSLRKLGTSTDTLTTLPVDLYADGNNATVGLVGNMEQTGTPTPENPITPQETGDRTAQLYFKKIVGGSIGADGGIIGNASFDCYVAKVEANQQYIGTGFVYAFYTSEPTLGSISYNGQRVAESAANAFTSPIDGYVAVRHNSDATDAMLNTGSTALPYQPYGYKIPISSGGENLFDEEYPNISGTLQYMALNLGNGTYTLSSTVEISQGSAGTLFFLAGNVSSGASTATNAVYKDRPITVTSTDGYVTIAYRTYTVDTPVGKETMLNLGSTPLPYEPYNRITVYLGEVESTRRISKFILTGQEEWGQTSNYCFFLTKAQGVPENYYSAQEITIVCSHFQPVSNRTSTQYVSDRSICFYYYSGTSTARELFIRYNDLITVTDFKTYLQQQYAAGTPVTVWYVLATPTTGIVNEPLRKIGEYADSITGVTIPTITGKDSFDVLTTLKPSEVSLAYTGWHDASVKEWDGSQWQ